MTPVATALPLAGYAGTYGERTVVADSGKLIYQRQGGPKFQLIAVGPNEFAFEEDPIGRVTFKVAGSSATALELLRGDGSKVLAERSQ